MSSQTHLKHHDITHTSWQNKHTWNIMTPQTHLRHHDITNRPESSWHHIHNPSKSTSQLHTNTSVTCTHKRVHQHTCIHRHTLHTLWFNKTKNETWVHTYRPKYWYTDCVIRWWVYVWWLHACPDPTSGPVCYCSVRSHSLSLLHNNMIICIITNFNKTCIGLGKAFLPKVALSN